MDRSVNMEEKKMQNDWLNNMTKREYRLFVLGFIIGISVGVIGSLVINLFV